MAISYSARVTPGRDVLFRTVGDEALLLKLDTEQYLGLDPVGARIWTVLSEAPSIQAAYDRLLDEYDVTPERLRQDLEQFLGTLIEQGLIHAEDNS